MLCLSVVVPPSRRCAFAEFEFHAESVSVATAIDEPLAVELRPSLRLPDDDEVQLPIVVAPASVGVDPGAGPRVASVRTTTPDGVYGAGTAVELAVVFTGPVDVVGDLARLGLELNTGCGDSSCGTPEVQTFECKADSGRFALVLFDGPGGLVRNVDAAVDQEGLEPSENRPPV